MRCSLVGDKNNGYAEYAEINYLKAYQVFAKSTNPAGNIYLE